MAGGITPTKRVPNILDSQRPNTVRTTRLTDRLSTRARVVDDNRYYVAQLYQPSTGLSFRAFVPETFTISVQNHWEPLLGDLNDSRSSGVGRVAAGLGAPINLKYLTRQIWTGTEPLHFNFTFLLDAYGSTEQDVQEPIINLLKMSTPKRDGIFLKAPGPTLISDENRIYLRIGRFFMLDSVIIDSVELTFYTVADKNNGKFMSADIAVQIQSAYTPDQDDILQYFLKGELGDNSLNNQLPGVINDVNSVTDYIKNSPVSQGVKDYFNQLRKDINPGLQRPD